MTRNNSDRIGANTPVDASQHYVSQEEQVYKVPTEFVDLPTQGYAYPEDHPLYHKKDAEINFMTAKEEDILVNKSYLRKNIAIDKFLSSILVDKKIDPRTLLIADKNAILVAARINGYGEFYSPQVTCPSCREVFNHQFNLNEVKIKTFDQIVEEKEDAVSVTDKYTFKVELPRSKVEVEFKLLNGFEEKKMAKLMEVQKKRNLAQTSVTSLFREIIVSVDGSTSDKDINSFVSVMTAFDSRYLRTIYKKYVPNVDMKQELVCDHCGHSQQMEVPMTAEFFWPER